MIGKRCNVPTSAAKPTHTSRTANFASSEQIRTSHTEARSIPPPKHNPFIAAITGMGHVSICVKHRCIAIILGNNFATPIRAISGSESGFWVYSPAWSASASSSWSGCNNDGSVISNPDVKATEPAPVKIMARQSSPDWEKWSEFVM